MWSERIRHSVSPRRLCILHLHTFRRKALRISAPSPGSLARARSREAPAPTTDTARPVRLPSHGALASPPPAPQRSRPPAAETSTISGLQPRPMHRFSPPRLHCSAAATPMVYPRVLPPAQDESRLAVRSAPAPTARPSRDRRSRRDARRRANQHATARPPRANFRSGYVMLHMALTTGSRPERPLSLGCAIGRSVIRLRPCVAWLLRNVARPSRALMAPALRCSTNSRRCRNGKIGA